MTHPLDGCRLRLDRAKFHMDELDQHFRSYCLDKTDWSYHAEVRDTPWNLQIEGDPTLGVIAGETIQNVRTALDYLVYALILHVRGRKPRNMTQFPISDTAGDFFSKRYQIIELPGELRRRIRKLQPYQTDEPRRHPLSRLRRLSNADKHRLLLAPITQIGDKGHKTGFKIRTSGVPTKESTGIAMPVYLEGTDFEKDVLSRNPNVFVIGYFSILIEATDEDLFGTLKRFLWTATEIIDGFEDVCVY